MGLRCRNTPGPFTQLKAGTIPLIYTPKWGRTLPSSIYFHRIFRHPPPKKIKYPSCYLTACCGLEVQKPTQVLHFDKGPANTFDWSPKWVRTLLSLIYFSWDIYRDPLNKRKFKYQSCYLTPYCGLEVQKPTQALQSVKGPGNTYDWHPKWATTVSFLKK